MFQYIKSSKGSPEYLRLDVTKFAKEVSTSKFVHRSWEGDYVSDR